MRVFRLEFEKLDDISDTVRELEAGDVVYLTGRIVTARDRAHMRIVEALKNSQEKDQILKDLIPEILSCPIYHCGPLVKKDEEGLKVISAGPTTSARMNRYAEILQIIPNPVIIGKGGMSEEVMKYLSGRGVYLAFPGGAGALAAEKIEKVEKVYWEDLGMAEAVYVLRVRDFGPCVVGMDSKGRSLYNFSVGAQ